jgi:hypothetical protein
MGLIEQYHGWLVSPWESSVVGSTVRQGLYICITGIGTGWLAGLSLSPVVGELLASVLGLVGGVVAGTRALRKHSTESARAIIPTVDAAPVALLIVGMSVGAPLGILARTHDIFAPSSVRVAGVRTPSKDVPSIVSANNQPGLYDSATSECGEFLAVEQQDQSLRALMLSAKSSWPSVLAKLESDPNALRQIMEAICLPRSS